MDIERYKRLATSKITAGKATKVVREAMKDLDYSKQDQYEERGEKFKPESQKVLNKDKDEKQDELVRELLQGQDDVFRAIEYGQKVKARKPKIPPKPNVVLGEDGKPKVVPIPDIVVLDDDGESIIIPDKSGIDFEKPIQGFDVNEPINIPNIVNLDKGIDSDYEETLNDKGLPMPSKISDTGMDIEYWIRKTIGKIKYMNDYVRVRSTKRGKPYAKLSDHEKDKYYLNEKRIPYLKVPLKRNPAAINNT